jgi:N-methylhydantoinase B/oxoprolinase/acetone carboxylase alpha subunit
MKRLLGIVVFALVSAAMFAEFLHTSEGTFSAEINYMGEYCGQQSYEASIKEYQRQGVRRLNKNIKKLTNGQWECVNTMLKHYETTEGDTFEIIIGMGSSLPLVIYCEFTSDTQYVYWAFNYTFW